MTDSVKTIINQPINFVIIVSKPYDTHGFCCCCIEPGYPMTGCPIAFIMPAYIIPYICGFIPCIPPGYCIPGCIIYCWGYPGCCPGIPCIPGYMPMGGMPGWPPMGGMPGWPPIGGIPYIPGCPGGIIMPGCPPAGGGIIPGWPPPYIIIYC